MIYGRHHDMCYCYVISVSDSRHVPDVTIDVFPHIISLHCSVFPRDTVRHFIYAIRGHWCEILWIQNSSYTTIYWHFFNCQISWLLNLLILIPFLNNINTFNVNKWAVNENFKTGPIGKKRSLRFRSIWPHFILFFFLYSFILNTVILSIWNTVFRTVPLICIIV